jgi:hypothetical protein
LQFAFIPATKNKVNIISAKAFAVAKPMPELAPVMSAILFINTKTLK